MTFDEIMEALTSFGWGVELAEKQRLIARVELPWTPDDWFAAARSSGDAYLGGCCGKMSSVQDIVNGWFRDGYSVKTSGNGWDTLGAVVTALCEHDGLGPNEPDCVVLALNEPLEVYLANPEKVHALSPWKKIGLLWTLIKDHLFISPVDLPCPQDSWYEVDQAVWTLGRAAQSLSFHRAFSDGELSPQEKVNYTLIIARLYPALKTVLAGVDQLGGVEFEGYALIDTRHGDDAVCENGLGACLYSTEDEYKRVLELWKKSETEPGFILSAMRVRPIRVSYLLPGGFEFTGPTQEVTLGD